VLDNNLEHLLAEVHLPIHRVWPGER